MTLQHLCDYWTMFPQIGAASLSSHLDNNQLRIISENSLVNFTIQVVGGKLTETGRLGAFITKVKKGSLADVVGHLRAGK